MKSIILAAGKGNLHLQSDESIPKCLESFDSENTILDMAIDSFNKGDIYDISLVGGYEIEKVMSHSPEIKYFYNEKWQKTKSLYSLLKASSEFDDDLIISYSDIVFTPSIIRELVSSNEDVSIAYDSIWAKRFEGRTDSYLKEAEKVYVLNEQVSVSKDGICEEALGEFAGLLSIKKSCIRKIEAIIKKLLIEGKDSIPHLLTELGGEHSISCIDIKGHWAELDSSQDLAQFKFGTKAETLKKLEGNLDCSTILPQYSFTVEDYIDDSEQVITDIQNSFKNGAVVIRSSALNEDTENSSMAGNYESILNIKLNDRGDIKRGIELVRDSYLKGEQDQHPKNQILVQPMLENVTMSGVLFTKDLETSAPYYTINYDLSGSTESITAGEKGDHHTLIFYKFSNNYPDDYRIKNLIHSVKEIENKTGYSSLDIEFAFSDNTLYILQVRPIAAHKDSLKVSGNDITNELLSIKKYICNDREKSYKLVGSKVAYGVMPDWNPAEIIGISPKPLSFSLYKDIITDRIWPQSRIECGYRDTIGHPGIVSFSGKPYVDIRMSFNSFTPATLDSDIANKLIDFYISKLNQKPHLHDKVEFDVAITAYDFTLNKRLTELLEYGFTEDEVKKIKLSFIDLTNNIINEKDISIEEEIQKTISLEKVRNDIRNMGLNPLSKAFILLESTKELGTVPFSNLARFGFIGAILLKSLRSLNIISNEFYDDFFKSVHTVAKEFVFDIHCLNKEELIKKYGHLRPGTYEISSEAYHENFDHYINLDNKPKLEEKITFSIPNELQNQLDHLLNKHKLSFNCSILFNFIRKATEARELAKFEFSKNLSLALDYITDFCLSIGISRYDASYLEIKDLKCYSEGSISSNIYNELRNKIEYNKSKHLITSAIKLPELILSEKDIDYFFLSQSQPNFITQKQVTGEIIVLEGNEVEIEGKIVCIENADPGFDWIFSHSILGLITKYGGTNSHMAIRCAEFELPAAIGCGDTIYNKLAGKSKIYLDSLGKKIEVIS